mgnify:CR=1 FL=1
MFKRTYKRNISLLAGLEFTSYFGITSFWILFFIQNGLSLLQIGDRKSTRLNSSH